MQEEAVERRGHAVLADAEMDEAALWRLGGEPSRLRLVVVGAGEVGGARDEFERHRRRDHFDHGFRRFAGRDIERIFKAAPSCVLERPLQASAARSCRSLRSNRRRLADLARHSALPIPGVPRPPARRPSRQLFKTSRGPEKRLERDADFSLAASIQSAPSASPCALAVPALFARRNRSWSCRRSSTACWRLSRG